MGDGAILALSHEADIAKVQEWLVMPMFRRPVSTIGVKRGQKTPDISGAVLSVRRALILASSSVDKMPPVLFANLPLVPFLSPYAAPQSWPLSLEPLDPRLPLLRKLVSVETDPVACPNSPVRDTGYGHLGN